MKKIQRLSKTDSEIFRKRITRFSADKQRTITNHYKENSDGSITILDMIIISSIASSLFNSDHYESFDPPSFDSGGGGDFGGGGSSGSWDDNSSSGSCDISGGSND
jgi:uncharacterized membrane protein YgcG